MSPADLMRNDEPRAFPPAVLALLLAVLLAALLYVQLHIGAPDVQRYQKLAQAKAGAVVGTKEMVSLPPSLKDVIDANVIPTGSEKASASTEFLEFMSRRATQSRLKLQSITPGAREDTPAKMRVQAILHMTGNFSQLESLLEGLARGRELIAVDHLSLKRDNEHGQGLIVELWVSRIWINPGASA